MPNIERLKHAREVCLVEPSGDVVYMKNFTTNDTPCGTVHCVIGACALDPWFQKHTEILDILMIKDGNYVWPRAWSAAFMPLHLAAMFGISEAEVWRTFYADADIVQKAYVLANLDALIEGQPTHDYSDPYWQSWQPKPQE